MIFIVACCHGAKLCAHADQNFQSQQLPQKKPKKQLILTKTKLKIWLNARDFAREYLRSCMGYGPGRSVKRRGKSSSLHSKKNFLPGVVGFL